MSVVKVFVASFGVSCAIFLAVWLSGATFGQRCAKLHPNDAAAQALCVKQLASGR